MLNNYREINRPLGRRLERSTGAGSRRPATQPSICESLEPRQFLSVTPAISPDQSSTLPVTVGPHQHAQFTDAEGNSDIFSLSGPGTATITFAGTDLATTVVKGGVAVGGTSIGVSSISITGTNRHTSIVFALAKHTTAHGALPVGSLTTNGAVGALTGNIDVTGALTIGGTLGKVAVSGLDGGTSTPTSLTAASIGSLSVLGNLGEIVTVSGDIGKVVVRGNVTGSISGALITSLTVGGNVTGSTIALAQPLIQRHSDLGKLTVSGTVSTTTIQAGGNIGPVAVGALSNSSIEAGITLSGGSGLPTTPDEFTSRATLSSVKSKTTASTDIAAFTVGKLALGSLTTSNDGVPFGIAGATVAQVTGIASITGRKFNIKKLNNQALVTAALVKLGITGPGVDFTIVIV